MSLNFGYLIFFLSLPFEICTFSWVVHGCLPPCCLLIISSFCLSVCIFVCLFVRLSVRPMSSSSTQKQIFMMSTHDFFLSLSIPSYWAQNQRHIPFIFGGMISCFKDVFVLGRSFSCLPRRWAPVLLVGKFNLICRQAGG